jgi:hypothetical protein
VAGLSLRRALADARSEVIPVPMKIRFCDTIMSYIGMHEAEPDPDEPGFCFCGLELDERVHTDREKYAPKEGTDEDHHAGP